MKKNWMALAVCGILAISMTGCSSELSNDYITINQYKELEVAQVEVTEVTDDDVESAIETNLASAQTEVTDRAAEEGDTVDIDYVGSVDGVEFDGGSATGASLELGSGTYIGANGDYEGFEDQIIGHTTGENFDITVQFPSDYSSTDLADKVAVFNITLNTIYETPELTDEWVQANSDESETVEEYQEEVRQQQEESAEETQMSSLKSEVREALLEQIEVKEYPEDEVDEQYQEIVDYYTSYAEVYGMELEDFLSTYMGMTEEEFEEEAQSVAQDAVATKLAYELIAEKENLTPSDEEYEERTAEYAETYGYDDVDTFVEDYGEDVIQEAILQDVVEEYLVEHCVQVESTDSEE